jgi:CO/xanthine dehydrogenase Mo-binding subunit
MIELNLNAGLLAPGTHPGLWARLRQWLGPRHQPAAADLWAECRVDEAARAAWRDPVQFRREHVPEGSRARQVLDEAARRAGWGSPPPAGMSRGVAMGEIGGTWVALVAEVSEDGDGGRVHRVVAAVDCGAVMDFDDARLEIQRGLRAGLHAEVDHADHVRLDVWWVCGDVPGRDRGEAARRAVGPALANALRALHDSRARARALAEATA